MRVLLLFPMADGQTGPAIKYAFEQLGHCVKAVDARLQTNKIYDDYCNFKAELVFCTKTPEVTDYIRRIKKEFNLIVCMWNVDTRTDINHWKRLFPLIDLCDYHFVPDTKTIPEWRKLNQNTFWLPQGVQNEIYHKPERITEEDRKKYCCDVSWAGTAREQRRPFLKAINLMNINFKQWGCKGVKRIYDEKHNKMVSLSTINLCCSGWPENESYTSVRDYKIMGAGGFVLELQRKGLEKIFPLRLPGLMGTYISPDDLVQRIRWWLDHEDERKAMAERAHKWVHANATYTHRIKMALDYMGLN